MAKREFYIVITKDEDGCFFGEAPQLRDCYGQGKTREELMRNMRKAIELCIEDDDLEDNSEFFGIRKIEV